MYKGRYVSELSMEEVVEYYDILRKKRCPSEEEVKDFGICKERLIVFAYKTLTKGAEK